MDNTQIIETVNRLFIAVDQRDWNTVKSLFHNTVLLDYTSMSGGDPVTLTADQIIDSWKGILPGFDCTHHQLGNYLVDKSGDTLHVFCYGTATHYLKNDSGNHVWTVVGSYDLNLLEQNNAATITHMKFSLKYMDGNLNLPSLAQQRLTK